MKAFNSLQNALIYLDEGNVARARAQLLETIPLAEREKKDDVLLAALCCLAELHVSAGEKAEAAACLRRALALPPQPGLEPQRERAADLLRGLGV